MPGFYNRQTFLDPSVTPKSFKVKKQGTRKAKQLVRDDSNNSSYMFKMDKKPRPQMEENSSHNMSIGPILAKFI